MMHSMDTILRDAHSSCGASVARSVCHIITVGTSLLVCDEEPTSGPGEALYKKIKDVKSRLTDVDTHITTTGSDWNHLVVELLKLDGDSHIERRAGGDPDFLPQELSYLHLYYRENSDDNVENDAVFLLESSTDDGHACARVIQEYLKNATFQNKSLAERNTFINEIVGLNPAEEKLGNDELQSFAQIIGKIIESYGKTHRIILNFSGGFKGLIPYATFIASIYDQIELKYLFRHAKAINPIPAMPIAFDIAAWRDSRALIRIIPQIDDKEARRRLVESLRSGMQPIFELDGSLSFLGSALQNKFELNRASDLSLYGPGEQLLCLLEGDYLTAVKERLPYWHYSSMGDKVPEMIDHGSGHLHRVQELVAQFLLPLNEVEKNFFNQEEYLALISATWLHDIGHSAEYLELPFPNPLASLCKMRDTSKVIRYPTAGFPSLSRDFHHLLTACLLLSADSRKAYITDFWNDFRLEALLYICLYHRRSMPLVNSSETFKDGADLGFEISACKEKVAVNGFDVRTRLLAALYSICDGCDAQWERAATDKELEARRHYLARSVGALLDKADHWSKPSGCLIALEKLKEISSKRASILNYCHTGIDGDEIGDWLKELDAFSSKQLKEFFFSNRDNLRDPALSCSLEALSLIDRIQFMTRQSGFYAHHRAVKAVYILYLGAQNGSHVFRICAIYDPKKPEQARKIVLGDGTGKKGSLWAEVQRSEEVLKKYGIEVIINEESLQADTNVEIEKS